MDWSSDLESGGHRFDSRLPEGRFGITCSSILECLGMCLGVFGDVYGWVCNGFGNISDGGETLTSSKMTGRICPGSGYYLKIACFGYPRQKVSNFHNKMRLAYFCLEKKLFDKNTSFLLVAAPKALYGKP